MEETKLPEFQPYESDNPNDSAEISFGSYIRSKIFLRFFLATVGGALLLLLLFFYLFLPFYTNHGASITVPEIVNLKLNKGADLLDKNDLKYVVTDSEYYASLPPLTIVRQDPPAFEKVKPGRKIYLVINRLRPPQVKLPEILEVNFQQCKYMLELRGLKVGAFTYVSGFARDQVLKAFYKDRELMPGNLVTVGSKIDLVISRGQGTDKVKLPNLVGLSLSDATEVLATQKLSIGGVRYAKSNRTPEGTVFKQYPDPASVDSVIEGYTVDIYINGQPPEEKIIIE